MGYGPTNIAQSVDVDLVPPGAPVFSSITQLDNTNIEVKCVVPALDANGAALSGLIKLTVATVIMPDVNVNPFDGLAMDAIMALPDVQVVHVDLVPADAGAEKVVLVPIVNLGGCQALAVACSD